MNVSPAQLYGHGVDVKKWVAHLAEIGLPPAVAFEQWGNMWEPEQLLSIGA